MRPLLLLAAAAAAAAALPLCAQEPTDGAMLARIRAEGLEHSRAWSYVDTIATVFGPRLTGSPAHVKAANWVKGELASMGLSDVHLEPWQFGRGWVIDKFSAEMIEPRYLPLHAFPEGWSASTAGEITGQPLVTAGLSYDALAAMQSSLKGSIVLSMPLQTSFERQDREQPSTSANPDEVVTGQPRPGAGQRAGGGGAGRAGQGEAQRIAKLLHDAGVGLVLKSSRGEHGTMFVLGRDAGENAVPSVIVEAEQYNQIMRLLADHVPVKLRFNVQTHYLDQDKNTYNVIAELPGTDPKLKDQVVMIGGHLDSWHSGTGATDNADGVATVMEAMRILKTIGAKPRRTIRVAVWSGEEEGLLGSKAWAQQHLAGDANKAARDNFDVYLNIDPGYGKIYGWYMEGNPAAKSIFDAWLEPLKDLGARRNVLSKIGATDHLSFIAVGVPGFNPIQEYKDYDVRMHHTNVDTMDRLNEADLEQGAIVMATFAYDAAMRDAMIPRAVP